MARGARLRNKDNRVIKKSSALDRDDRSALGQARTGDASIPARAKAVAVGAGFRTTTAFFASLYAAFPSARPLAAR
jgi:hypothetical protein